MKKKLSWWLTLSAACILILTAGLAACSSESDNEEKKEGKNENTNTGNGSNTVTSDAGTVSFGDLTIDFPKGAFLKDAKVKVTEVKKGAVGGDYEASKFYKITMPVTTLKNLTLKVKSSEQGDDMRFVLRAPGYARSYHETVEIDSYLDAKYSDGEYTAILPPIDNDADIDESLELTVGMARLPQEVATTRGATLLGGQVGDVKWEIDYSLGALVKLALNKSAVSKIEAFKPTLNEYVKDAITKITNLGFKIDDKERKIPIYLESNPDRWGQHNQSRISNTKSSISVFYEKMLDSKPDLEGLKCTIIHELFHYFQAEYDPRCAYNKGGGFLNWAYGDELILYEMAAVWVEKFMNGGQLNAGFLKTEAFHHVFSVSGISSKDVLGIGMESERWTSTVKFKYYSQQGYSMASLLYYLTTQVPDFDDKAVLELHQMWKTSWKSGKFYDIFEDWVKRHDSYLLTSYTIDDYYMMLWTGSLVKDFCVYDVFAGGQTNGFFKNGDKKIDLKGTLYPFGCAARYIKLVDFKDISLEHKQLVIKQLDKNTHSYVLLADTTSSFRKFTSYHSQGGAEFIEAGDSVVISGSTLEGMRLKDGTFYHAFFIITTNIGNTMQSVLKNDFQATIELRDLPMPSVSPAKLAFPAEGGTLSVKVDPQGYKRYGYTIPKEYTSWLSASFAGNNTVNFTAQPNPQQQPRSATVYCFVTNVEKPTEAQKVNLPVEVTQDVPPVGTPSVSPATLAFPAEGGTLSVKVDPQGYKRYGYSIPKEYTSWLSASFPGSNTINFTAQPNTQQQPRSATVYCYVTNVEKPTDAEKVNMPVEVTQKAANSDQVKLEFESGTVEIDLRFLIGLKQEFTPTDKFATISKNGSGLRVALDISGETGGAPYRYTLSFDVDDLNLIKTKAAKVTNLKYSWESKAGEAGISEYTHQAWKTVETTLVSTASAPQTLYSNNAAYFQFPKESLQYHSKTTTYYDKWWYGALEGSGDKLDVQEVNTIDNYGVVNITLKFRDKQGARATYGRNGGNRGMKAEQRDVPVE